ncbi:MAG: tetratricopeptide repeat protein, partial [Defluviitaleaceae bacterium]|nr:tetratricopeptide repeat protein [Defluviitaleaceae bacterium]
MSELLLCISQDEPETPYQFKTTGVNVFSFEEAVYHCYHNWKQSIDDFTSEEFLAWTRDTLGLSFLSSRIQSLSKLANFSDRLIGFLSIIDYFDEARLSALKTQLTDWETRLEWERLKDRADYLLKKNDPQRAYVLYHKALGYGENAEILNNLAIAFMKLEHYEQAEKYFERALLARMEVSPQNNLRLLLNLAEAAIYNHNFVRAEQCLREAESIEPDMADIAYLYGELSVETDNIRHSIEFFEKALSIEYDPHFIYRIAETYVRLRKYDAALEALAKV